MKKPILQAIAVLLSLLLFTGMTGCLNEKNTDMPKGSETSQVKGQDDKENVPVNQEKVMLRMLRSLSCPEYPADGGVGKKILLDYAEKNGLTGFDFRVDLVAPSEYDSKLNLLAVSGDLPDYFNIKLNTMNKFAEDGFLMELDNLTELMPNAQMYWKKEDLEVVKYDGKLFAFPGGYRLEPLNQPYVGGFIARKDWLENVGLEEPKTLDDFYNVLKAFTNNDPDGNEKPDTYGLGGQKANLSAVDDNVGYFGGIFGAYGIFPNFWHERDGKLKHGSTLPETKEVLSLMRTWYQEKLIDPEFMIIDKKQMDEKLINSKVGIVPADAFYTRSVNAINAALVSATPEAKLIMIEPPTGPKGDKGWAQKAPGYDELGSISATCKNPEVLVKFLDILVKEPEHGGPFITIGREGIDFNYDKSTNVTTLLKTSQQQWSEGLAHPVEFIKIVDRRWVTEEPLMKALETASGYITKNEFWKSVPAMRDYPDLTKLWNEYFVKIVSNELPLSAWDEYVEKFYKQGGSEVEEQVNMEWNKN